MNKPKSQKSKIKATFHNAALDTHKAVMIDVQSKPIPDNTSPTSMNEFMAQEIRTFLKRKDTKKS